MIQILDIIDTSFTPSIPPTAPVAIATKDVASTITTADSRCTAVIAHNTSKFQKAAGALTTLSIARVDTKQGKEKDQRKHVG